MPLRPPSDDPGRIRDVVPEDLPRLLEINNEAVPAVGVLDPAGLEGLVERSVTAIVATAADDEPVGFCLVLPPGTDYASVNYRWFSERYERFAYLDRVAIAPSHRGRSLGRRMYARVAADARARGDVDVICLEVNLRPRNDPSLAFHDRLGFVEVGQQETPYGALVSLQTRTLTGTGGDVSDGPGGSGSAGGWTRRGRS